MNTAHAVLAVFVLAVCCGCRSEPDAVPAHLLGVWRTPAPAYADRFLELKERTITFGVGGGGTQRFVIARIEAVRSDNGADLYTVTYVNEDRETHRLSFFYEEGNGGRIRLKNQTHLVWAKAEG